ncbi:MAG: hypothetical protein QM758_05825 [Armatimonas sp.]
MEIRPNRLGSALSRVEDAPGDVELPDPPAPPHPDDFSERPQQVKDILHAATHASGL